MTQNTDTTNKANVNPAGTFNMRVGNTTYVVGVHFSQTSKDTLEDKLLRLIKNDIRNGA